MEVKDKTMYHFHHNFLFKDIWVPGNELTVDNNFNSQYGTILKRFKTGFMTKEKLVPFNKIIRYYLDEKADTETYIKLLEDAEYIIKGTNLFEREMALEIVRRLCYPELPSREHSIWLCDENSMRHWESTLSSADDLELFRVSVTGELFKSSDAFLPDDGIPFIDIVNNSKKYWEPKFENEYQENQAEYLFQGKVKILEKIKKTN